MSESMSSISILSCGAIIRETLAADPVLSIHCNKVFPVIAEDTCQLPYIDYARESVNNTAVASRKPMAGASSAAYTINCYARTYEESLLMAERVVYLLDNMRFEYTDDDDNKLSVRNVALTDASEQWAGDAYVQTLTFTFYCN